MNFENDGPTRDRRSRGLWCHAMLLCSLLCSTTVMAEERTGLTSQNLGETAQRQASLATHTSTSTSTSTSASASPLSVGLDAVPLLDSNPGWPLGGPAANDFGASRWGPRRGLTDTSALAPRGPNGASLYAYVDLGSALPARLRELIGQPDGGVTLDLRGGANAFSGPSMGSMMRWNNRDGSQLALRLRRGKLSLQYGLHFWH
jgi:hypothetical protein